MILKDSFNKIININYTEHYTIIEKYCCGAVFCEEFKF